MRGPGFQSRRGKDSGSWGSETADGRASGNLSLFYVFGAVLVYAVLFLGVPISQARIEDRQSRDIFLIAIGLLGLIGGFVHTRSEARSRGERILIAAAIGLPCYALLQFAPLPAGLIGILSPARGELLKGLEPVFGHPRFASLSIAPAATLTHFLLFASYAVILLGVRGFALRARRHIWIIAVPVVVAAAIEAAMGLAQFLAGGDAPVARGTYVVRNHLAGLLEMALPVVAMYGVAHFRSARHRSGGARDWLRAAGGFAVAGLLGAGALATLSRGGFFSLLGSAMVMGAISIGRDLPPKRRLGAVLAVCFLVIIGAFYVAPMDLIARLAEHSSAGRLTVWRESLGVIASYPLAGCGLGGFESAFLKFKSGLGTFSVDYAHNDYLQFLAELGAAGFMLGVLLFGAAIVRSARVAMEDSDLRWAGLACLGSLTAILVHSMVDFNLYVAANASVAAWICGMAGGLTASPPRERRRVTAKESTWDEVLLSQSRLSR
jgi:O-antigen ligase